MTSDGPNIELRAIPECKSKFSRLSYLETERKVFNYLVGKPILFVWLPIYLRELWHKMAVTCVCPTVGQTDVLYSGTMSHCWTYIHTYMNY